MEALDIGSFRNIVVLTGAGISVASGIRPFRGPDGLWNDETLVRLSCRSTLESDPAAVWRFWAASRRICGEAKPNAAHEALAAFEASLGPGRSFTLITQNVDGLHVRAGSRNVIEYHGAVRRSRCMNESCPSGPFTDPYIGDELPRCPRCGSPLRPDIVLFEEMIPPEADLAARRALGECDLFVAIGSSGTVYPAAGWVQWVESLGGETVYLNLEANSGNHFKRSILGRAEETVPRLFAAG